MLSKLYPFQLEDVQQLERWDCRALLASEMGTGKSVVALGLLDRNASCWPAVVICEASLKLLWQRMFKQHLGLENVAVLYGTTPDIKKVKGKDAIIINPDVLYAWIWTLQSIKPGLVIADEVQWAKTPEAGRTWALRELVQTVPHFLPMSGTPIENRPIEFWSVLNMLDPSMWPSYHAYGHRYCRPRRNSWSQGWDFKGATRTAELHEILVKNYMVRRLKKEVLKELPDKLFTTVPLRLKPKEMKEYKRAEADIKSWLSANYNPKKADAARRAAALTRVNVLRELTLQLKLPHVHEWAESFMDSDEKLILFGQHRKFVRETHERFLKKSTMVYGGLSDRQRLDAFDRFNDRKECQLFVGNQAASKGWSATACSNVALGEFPWRPTDVGQMIARAHGLFRGQVGVATTAYFLTAVGTIDERMLQALQEKEDMTSSVLDGGDWREKTESVFDSVVTTLLKESR